MSEFTEEANNIALICGIVETARMPYTQKRYLVNFLSELPTKRKEIKEKMKYNFKGKTLPYLFSWEDTEQGFHYWNLVESILVDSSTYYRNIRK